MLSGPTDYFGDTHHLRGGFPTPNESSLRTGLTPGGSGSMFPAPSPNSALFAQLASGGATPSTLDFHRTALSAAAKRDQAARAQPPAPQPPAVTSQPQDMTNGTVIPKVEPKSSSGPFDPHDNDAANGLFMLAQGRNGAQPTPQFTVTTAPTAHAHPPPAIQSNINTSPPMANNVRADSKRGVSEISNGSDDSDQKPQTRGKGKKNPLAANGRRKADEMPARAPAAKKTKANSGAASSVDEEHSDEDMDRFDENAPGRSKMTDEEKRKNFLERNRYVTFSHYQFLIHFFLCALS